MIIGNSEEQDSPLIFNLSCVYLFGMTFPGNLVTLIEGLPADFVYSFSPSSHPLFPNLKRTLFTEQIENHQIFCYNSRMTADSTAINLSNNSIGNAIFGVEIVPFSSSFCDIIANFGGLKTFFPLFKQADFPVIGSKTNPRAFLCALIDLFWRFCQYSPEIEADFFNWDGTKCLAYLLRDINASTFQPDVLAHLSLMYNDLHSPEHKLAFLDDIWLNLTLWNSHSAENRACLYTKLLRFFDNELDCQLFLKVVSVPNFAFLAIEEPDEIVAKKIWTVTVQLAQRRFLPREQLFCMAIALRRHNHLFLEHDLDFLQDKLQGFHQIIEQIGSYQPFVSLLGSSDDEIRVLDLRFLIEIFFLENEKGIEQFQISLIDHLLSPISIFNVRDMTERSWSILMNHFVTNPEMGSDLFPFICFLSSYHDLTEAAEFVGILANSLTTNPLLAFVTLLECPGWYFWLLFLKMQIRVMNQTYFDFHPSLCKIDCDFNENGVS
jgi:hypothetical protein